MSRIPPTDARRHRRIDHDPAVFQRGNTVVLQGPSATAIADGLYAISGGNLAARVAEHRFFDTLPQLMSHGMQSGALPVHVRNRKGPRACPGVKVSADFARPVIQTLAQNRPGFWVLDDFTGRQIDRPGACSAHSAMKLGKPIEMLKGQFGAVGPEIIRLRIQRETELEPRSQFFIILRNRRFEGQPGFLPQAKRTIPGMQTRSAQRRP